MHPESSSHLTLNLSLLFQAQFCDSPFPRSQTPGTRETRAGLWALQAPLGTAGRKGEKERSCLFPHDNSRKQLSYIPVLALAVLACVQTSHLIVHSACPKSGASSGINNPLPLHKILLTKCFLWSNSYKTFQNSKRSSIFKHFQNKRETKKTQKIKNVVASLARRNITFPFIVCPNPIRSAGEGQKSLFHTLI